MALKIDVECIACGACEPECPNDAITEGEEIYVIDPDLCSECVGAFSEPRCAEVCPVDVCRQDPDRQETEGGLLEKYNRIRGK
ncbi:MAG: YfhL family 4Fe-4S dicluster ferredoxin [bacterium]|nr:MAG: YfhL family 4Fe-4S dicluster ferredoxin [bacterium]